METSDLDSEVQKDRSRVVTILMATVVLISPSFWMYADFGGVGRYYIRSFTWEYIVTVIDNLNSNWFSPSPFLFLEPIVILLIPTLYLIRETTMHYRREVPTKNLVFWIIISALCPWIFLLIPSLLTVYPDSIIFFPIPSIVALILIKFKAPQVGIWSE